MQSPFIKCENVSFRYGEEKDSLLALKNVSLEIEKGQFVAILGHNGSGKSTLAKHFNAVLTPTEGKITVNGIDTADEERVFELRREVGMVFQNPDNQIVATIVEEDVAFAPENLGVEPSEIRKRVDDALEAVSMSKYKKHQPHKLSGGQKQRVAIAGVLAMGPECIVLDEPTAMLDPKGRADVVKTVKKLNEQGVTVVFITHYMDEAAQAKRVVVIDEGEVLIDGTPHYVFQNAGLLTSVGLDVPQSTSLMFLLRRYGLQVPLAVLTEEECISVLSDILTRKNKT